MTEAQMIELVRGYFETFRTADRERMESLLHRRFTFTSPYDDHIGRAAWFERCWPAAGTFESLDVLQVMAQGPSAYVTYEARAAGGQPIRNTELMQVEGGLLRSVEVFFGRPR